MFLDNAYNRDSFLAFCGGNFLKDFVKDERDFELDDREKSVCQLGKSKELNLSVLEFSIKSEDRNRRIAITQDAFKVLRKHHIRNALIAFKYDGDEWRLSLLTSTLRLDENGKVIKEESNPRRYSYLLGPGAKTKTPYQFLVGKGKVADFNDLLSRFSVEVVNKQFYNSIAELFMQLVGGKRNDKNYKGLLKIYGEEGPTQIKQEFAVRLIGRIVFCWFLKEKHSVTGVPLVDDELLSTDAVFERTDYYHNVLEPLFFEALNADPNERKEPFRKGVFANVPYLNGGLFSDRLEDHYKYNEFTGGGTPGLVEIPDNWFTDLFSVLNQYNFTVDENTSYDVDLSIDPEMLGRIFENLLAEINPQTGESARKSTGSFYTPREIVDYMVDNSLLYYLKDKTDISKQKLKAVISYGKDDDDEYPLDDNDKKEIVDALDELTILDPACGSGAFPIGILQKVVYVLQQADEDGKLWFEKQIKNIPSVEMQEDLRQKYESENYDYIRKLGVIRQSIFGVDIQTIATEIAKLRCFLTLVIEEEVDDNKTNRGIHPLPNLDFKFVTANSLIGLPDGGGQTSLLEDTSHIDALKKIRDEYFTASADKREILRARFSELQNNMFEKRIDSLGGNVSTRYDRLMRWKPFKNDSSEWFDPEWMFGVDKFDIVIANPPYVDSERMTKIMPVERDLYKDLYSVAKGNWDLYIVFFQRGFDLLNSHGVLCYISPNQWLTLKYGEELRKLAINSLVQLCDMRNIADFENASVNTFITLLKKGSSGNDVDYMYYDEGHKRKTYSTSRQVLRKYIGNFGVLTSGNIDVLEKIYSYPGRVSDYFDVAGTFCTSEYYVLTPLIKELSPDDEHYFKLVNTGSLNHLFNNKWGVRELKHDGKKFLCPVVDKREFASVFPRRIHMQDNKKLIISQSSGIKIFIDKNGEYLADKVLIIAVPKIDKNITSLTLGLILNSKLMRWVYKQLYSTGGMMGVTVDDDAIKSIPLPPYDELIKFQSKYKDCGITNYEMVATGIEKDICDLYNIESKELGE